MTHEYSVADWKATKKQRKLIKGVLKSGRLTYGPLTAELERKFAYAHGRKHALFTSSGTMALVIAIQELKDKYGWKDGAEVIMPAVTFVATMNAILYNNLKPVLVDVLPDTLNIDTTLIEKAITKKTVAIIPVNLLGLPSDMEKVMLIAIDNDLRVVEDSCETMFVSPAGEYSDIACFSTYLAHVLVAGIGGFICTDDDQLAKNMRSRMFHGRDDSYLSMDDNGKAEVIHKRFLFDKHGWSARATEFEAAIGLGEIDKWKQIIDARQQNAKYIVEECRRLELPITFPGYGQPHAYMLFPMLVQNRDALMEYLESWGVHTRTIMPLTNQPVVMKLGYKEKDYPEAQDINRRGILVGCHQYLERQDLDYLIATLRRYYA